MTKTYKLARPSAADMCRWAARLRGLPPDRAKSERLHAARAALPAGWRTRDKLTQPEWPGLDDLDLWRSLGRHDALLMLAPRVNATDASPYALAYCAGYVPTMGAYMMPETAPPEDSRIRLDGRKLEEARARSALASLTREQAEIASPNPEKALAVIHVPPGGIDPALALALVTAQASVGTVLKDGKNEQFGFSYATADQLVHAARTALTGAGLAWMRERVTLSKTKSLGDCAIGSQHYVGDALIEWMLVHVSGAVLRGSATVPIIAAPSRPHDKAAQASITYGIGYIVMGLLCIDRDDSKGGVNSRREPDDDGGAAAREQDERQRTSDLFDEYCAAYGMSKGEAWPQIVDVASVVRGEGFNDGPWAQFLTADNLEAITTVIRKGLEEAP